MDSIGIGGSILLEKHEHVLEASSATLFEFFMPCPDSLKILG